ncbi:hypothetical protein [Pectobacterium parmentieri]|uniref:hypothetical protein n=1 Tax=Pectobacterium parmentieri TaxID=1905730 RepID=UPI0013C404F7|nr:hypothetical protein [Pectobacterium parmentieri]
MNNKKFDHAGTFMEIEALALAARYLTEGDNERYLALGIMEVIGNLAAQAQKEIKHVA